MRRIVAVAMVVLAVTQVAASCWDPTTGRPPGRTEPAPTFRSSIATVTAADLGSSWRSGCPVGPSSLRRVRVDYWGYDGKVHTGDLIVHSTVASQIEQVFRELYAARFQVRRIHPVQVFGSDDDVSMRENNTSAFNCRRVAGTSKWSEHAYGTAIDINPVQNPYVTRSGAIEPPSGKPWADRSLRVPGMVHRNGVVRASFAAIGWEWGGDWSSSKDYQHFSQSGR